MRAELNRLRAENQNDPDGSRVRERQSGEAIRIFAQPVRRAPAAFADEKKDE